MTQLNALTTESANTATENIDALDTLSMVTLINKEDQKVALAIEKELPSIAHAVDEMAKRFANGGRIIYCGAGTSGRLGTLDAVELTPTYSVPPTRAFGLMAGGDGAMYKAVEGAEDSEEMGVADLKAHDVCEKDIVIGIAASGRTPYTIAALRYGNEVGALTISVSCNKEGEMNKVAQIAIAPVVGAEVISGSTRMKAGTAQKMVLNMLSTATMIKCGKVYKNYMVYVQPTNIKLVARSKTMIQRITGCDETTASDLYDKGKASVAHAVVMYESQCDYAAADKALSENGGKVREAITALKH